VASFIDDVIIEMETEEGYDKLVKEVVKRLTEDNLYVKLEKYKMKGVLDWPTPKGVKNVQKFLELVNYYC